MRRTPRATLGDSIAVLAVLLLFVTMVSACATQTAIEEPTAAPKGDTALHMPDNLMIFTTGSDFEKGQHDGTEAQTDGNGAVILKAGVARGTYTSPEVGTKPFEYMVLSWNADTPEGTYIEIEGRVHAGAQNSKQWSDWLSWGSWSSSAFTGEDGKVTLSGSAPLAKADDEVARVSTDELFVKGSSGETADKYQYRLILHGPGGNAGHSETNPKVILVACTIRNTLKGQAIPKVYPQNAPDLSKLDKDLDVPTYSQSLRYAKIAGSICSPTSVAMALGYHGIDVSPEEAAWGVNDYEADIFGNWPFNTAYAAAHGLTAYVEYAVPAEGTDPWYAVKKEINDGNPVVVSVRYRKPDNNRANEPPVEGVPIDSTGGHLVLVRGFTWKDGREFVIVNDPAAAKNDEVRRLYPADQFSHAWVKEVMYVLHVDENVHPCLQAHIAGKLVPVGSVAGGFQKYELQVDGNAVNLSTANLRSAVVSFNGEKTTPMNPRQAALGDESKLLWFRADSASGKYVFWFFDMNKDTYVAELEWKK